VSIVDTLNNPCNNTHSSPNIEFWVSERWLKFTSKAGAVDLDMTDIIASEVSEARWSAFAL